MASGVLEGDGHAVFLPCGEEEPIAGLLFGDTVRLNGRAHAFKEGEVAVLVRAKLDPIREVQVAYSGDILNLEVQPVTRAILVGLLQPVMAESVNFVNAPFIAESRGIRVTESKATGDADGPNWMGVDVQADGRRRSISGIASGTAATISEM